MPSPCSKPSAPLCCSAPGHIQLPFSTKLWRYEFLGPSELVLVLPIESTGDNVEGETWMTVKMGLHAGI